MRLLPLLLLPPLLTGCITPYLLEAKLDSDLPTVPVTSVGDSTRTGTIQGQASLQLQPRRIDDFSSAGLLPEWNTSPVRGTAQLELVTGPHLRLQAGAAYGGSPSAWGGGVLRLRDRWSAWEFGAFLGTTQVRSHGSYRLHDDEDGYTDTTRHTFARDDWNQWMCYSLKVAAPDQGPWLELRATPILFLADLGDEDLSESLGSLGIGWTQAIGKARATAAVNLLLSQGKGTPQLSFQVQHPLGTL